MEFKRHDSLPVGTLLHGHEVLSVINAGAFGIAYKVRHQETGEERVIKEYMPDSALRKDDGCSVLPKSSSEEELYEWGLKSFIDEALLLMGLSHPNIVPVIDAFRKFGTAYFVMPYLSGDTLEDWSKNHPKPSQTEMEHIFIPLLEGLKYLHEKGYLHRDIKPENIIIEPNGNPVLIDFGAARQSTATKSQVLTKVLTPNFAAIEQYSSNGPFTPALDLYGLAACMYYVIAGVAPEQAPDRVNDDFYSPLVLKHKESQFSKEFLQSIDKCLNLFAHNRFQSAMDFQLALMGMASNDIEIKDEIVLSPEEAIKQLRGLISFAGKDLLISQEEQESLYEEAERLGIQKDIVKKEIETQVANNDWELEAEVKKLTFDNNLDEIKELVQMKGFKRFLLHFFGVIYTLAILSLTLIFALSFVEAEFKTIIREALSVPEHSILSWLKENVIADKLAGVIMFGFTVYIPIWYFTLYWRATHINYESKDAAAQKIYKISESAPAFIGFFYVYILLIFNWDQFLIELISAILVLWPLSYVWGGFNDQFKEQVSFHPYVKKDGVKP